MPVRIRAIEARDSAEIAQILADLHQTSPVPIGPHWNVAQIDEECRIGGWAAADDDDHVKAFVLFRDSGAAWEVGYLGTAINAQRQGLMKSLLRHIQDKLPAGREIWLEVHEHNDSARRLYDTCGFREVGRRPSYYSDGGAAVLYNYG